MTLDFRAKGRAIFTQHGTAKTFWMSLLEELRGACRSTPAPENLFKAVTTSPKLSTKRVEECHKATANALRFGQRTRVDSQVSSLHYCTRVKELLEKDWRQFKNSSGHT